MFTSWVVPLGALGSDHGTVLAGVLVPGGVEVGVPVLEGAGECFTTAHPLPCALTVLKYNKTKHSDNGDIESSTYVTSILDLDPRSISKTLMS